jgi:hypothetical protein
MGKGRATVGELDPSTFPIEGVLKQAVGDDLEAAMEGWKFLGILAAADRPEAGVFLLGLMRLHREDLTRMAVLARAVARFPSKAAADALQAEFYRVPSTPATRTYLNTVLHALTMLPADLAAEALQELARDSKLSSKWRRKIEEVRWNAGV